MGGAFGTNEGRRGAYRIFGGENLRERDDLVNVGVHWRVILKWIFKK
jgi:hypothetical protein